MAPVGKIEQFFKRS